MLEFRNFLAILKLSCLQRVCYFDKLCTVINFGDLNKLQVLVHPLNLIQAADKSDKNNVLQFHNDSMPLLFVSHGKFSSEKNMLIRSRFIEQ